jgi:uncharacterized oxidoreductase
MAKMQLIAAETLDRVTRAIFLKAGWPEPACAELARHLVKANLSGHDSHGVGMIPTYVDGIRRGDLKPSNTPQDLIADGSFLVVDAHIALGQKVAFDTVNRACDVARQHGVCVLNLVNAHHIGRIGHYAELAAEQGLVALYWVNVAHARAPVAPFGGREGRLGTNPHTIGIPRAGGEPLILDFATSRIALGKVRVALNKGEQVGPDTLLDRDGHPTTEPGVMFEKPIGALLAFGEHKGSGLSIMAEILSAIVGRGTSVDQALTADVVINNLFGIIIDPARLGADLATREARLSAYVDYLKSSAPRDPAKPVMMPGDPERAARAKRGAEGIPVDEATWRQIVESAAYVGVDAEAVRRQG